MIESCVITASGSSVSTRTKAHQAEMTPHPSQVPMLKRRTIVTTRPSPGDNSHAASQQLEDDEEYHSKHEGGRKIDYGQMQGKATKDGWVFPVDPDTLVEILQSTSGPSQELTLAPTPRSSQGEFQEACGRAEEEDPAPSHTGMKKEWNVSLPHNTEGSYKFHPQISET
ncbi:hypothetical protein BDD12DRAFT_804929 [Trichophaea hybrida]|nr:hypothetical protein BDD12DRAFT_804929 [Trichophaea hybrida]